MSAIVEPEPSTPIESKAKMNLPDRTSAHLAHWEADEEDEEAPARDTHSLRRDGCEGREKGKQRAAAPPLSSHSAGLVAADRVDAHEDSKAIPTDPFQNRTNQAILDAIDELYSCGIPGDIAGTLPLIVIVGDQLSGKSSLLRSMTDLPFPIGDGLCTRFPTQISSRRTQSGTETITVEIRNSGGQRDERYGGFIRTVPKLTEESFQEIITEASALMGVAPPGETGFSMSAQKNFSRDILKINISGPNRTQFSIVDLPGIFASSTTVQNKTDIKEVRLLAKTWMDYSGALIVCVANGLAPAANQGIFELAKESDPNRSRTVGVLTKCDIIADITEPLTLAHNERIPLHPHGWFVVRNRSTRELRPKAEGGMDSNDRHIVETRLFSTPPWNTLPENHRGVHALRDYLSSLLLQDSKRKLPEFARRIRTSIHATQAELNELGDGRDTPAKHRQYLSEIAQRFSAVAGHSLRGHYTESTLLKGNALKVRKILVEAGERFAACMVIFGHAVPFESTEVPVPYEGTFAVASPVPFQPIADPTAPASFGSAAPTTPQPTIGPGKLSSESGFSPFTQPTSAARAPSPFGGTARATSIFGASPATTQYATTTAGIFGGATGSSTAAKPGSSFFEPGSARAPSPFGGTARATSIFGASPATTQYATTTAGIFGGAAGSSTAAKPGSSFFGPGSATIPPSATTSGLFKSTTGGFATASSSSLFGSRPATPQPTASGLFSSYLKSAEPVAGFGEAATEKPTSSNVSGPVETPPSTVGRLFELYTDKEPHCKTVNYYLSICLCGPFQKWSSEELRVVDYKQIAPAQSPKPTRVAKSAQASAPAEIDWWIKQEIKNNRGTELPGTPNPEVVPALFRRQASGWAVQARSHFITVKNLVEECSKKLLSSICPDEFLCEKLLAALVSQNRQAYAEGELELKKLIQDVMEKTLQTNDPRFGEQIKEARMLRFRNALARYRTKTNQIGNEPLIINDEQSLFNEVHISNTENLEGEIHDTLKAYYILERTQFTELVNKQVIQRYVDNPNGPLNAFSPTWVAGLSDEEAAHLAGESEVTVRARVEKRELLENLSRGQKILARKELQEILTRDGLGSV